MLLVLNLGGDLGPEVWGGAMDAQRIQRREAGNGALPAKVKNGKVER